MCATLVNKQPTPVLKTEKANYHVLIVEDNDTMRDGMLRVVQKLGHSCLALADAEQAVQQLREQRYHLIITDFKLPGMTGMELLQKVKQGSPDTEVLLITAYGTIELAVEAMQQGAADFITKPFSPDELQLKINTIIATIEREAELHRLAEENMYLRQEMEEQFNFGDIIGKSKAMQPVFRTINKVARGDSSVIIYGESGTGKELVARAIHKASLRKERPFIRVNCGALAEGLLESELFGHERGAFTGALKQKKGRFELAHRGTIFLDEIGDIPPATQVKLLRVLQEKEFERVGGEETMKVDVRVIAATHQNLLQLIEEGRFREDLYYRLHIIPISLPPLRQRKEDIPLLTEHFIREIAGELGISELRIEDQALHQLQHYHWPGNVRELENVIERAAVLCDENQIQAKDLPFFDTGPLPHTTVNEDDLDLNRTLERVEKQLIEKALSKSGGTKTEAARLLKIKNSALYYKLQKYGLL